MDKEGCLANGRVPVIGISRHRILTDGEGVTTLVGFWGCPLRCKYCLNKGCQNEEGIVGYYSVEELYSKVAVDDLYFQASGGGVTFGGGEPLLRSGFIKEFRKLCGDKWRITMETSLNVDRLHMEKLVSVVDEWIVDIKDWNDVIYRKYTRCTNKRLKENLVYLIEMGLADKVKIRVPLIGGYNTMEDMNKSVCVLKALGIINFEKFEYYTKDKKENENRIKRSKFNGKFNRGKAVCMVLKKIRENVAELNGIEYIPYQCNHNVCALGCCPKCDAELGYIENALRLCELENKKIII